MPAAELPVEVCQVFEAAGVTDFGDSAIGIAEEFAGMTKANVVKRLDEATARRAAEKSAESGGAQTDTSREVGLENRLAKISDEVPVDGIDSSAALGVVLWCISWRAQHSRRAIRSECIEDFEQMRNPARAGFLRNARKHM